MRWTGQPWPGPEPEEQGRLEGQGCQLARPTQRKACAPNPLVSHGSGALEKPPRKLAAALYCPPQPGPGLRWDSWGWPCIYTSAPICLGTGYSGRGHGHSNTEPKPRCRDIRPWLPPRPQALVLCLIPVWVPRGGLRYPVAIFLVCTLSPARGGLGPEVPRCPLGAAGQDSLGPSGQHTSPVSWPCSHLRPWGLSSQMPT